MNEVQFSSQAKYLKYWLAVLSLFVVFTMNAQTERYSLLPKDNKILPVTDTIIGQYPLYPTMKTLIKPIPSAYCYEELAVFCKLEVQLEKKFKFPVKIRLGEVNYVDMLEGKPHTPLQFQ